MYIFMVLILESFENIHENEIKDLHRIVWYYVHFIESELLDGG